MSTFQMVLSALAIETKSARRGVLHTALVKNRKQGVCRPYKRT